MTTPRLPFSEAPRRPSRPTHLEARDRVLEALEHTAGEAFRVAAERHVLAHLMAHGPTSGEALTRACRDAGICPVGGDDRMYGPVLARLSRAKRITTVAYVPRERGRGTAGGRVWALTRA